MKKKIVDIIGKVLMLISFGLIGYKLFQYKIDFSALNSVPVIAGLCAMFCLQGTNVLVASTYYGQLLLVISRKTVDRIRVISIYCSSNLYKYLPGNIMHYVGRNRLAMEDNGLTHAEVIFATLIENICLAAAAVFISLICVSDYLIILIGQANIKVILLVLAVVLIAAVVIVLLFRKKMESKIREYIIVLKRIKWTTYLACFSVNVLRLLIVSFIYLGTLMILGQPVTTALAMRIIGLYTLSWVVGFITPGAPGGLGVREALLIMFLEDSLVQSVFLSSIVIHRIVCIFGDVVAYALSVLLSNVVRPRKKEV